MSTQTIRGRDQIISKTIDTDKFENKSVTETVLTWDTVDDLLRAVGEYHIKTNAIVARHLNSDIAGLGLVKNSTNFKLDVNVDEITITIDTDVVKIKNSGVDTAQLKNSAVTNVKILAGTIDLLTKSTYVPVNKAGDSMSGLLNLLASLDLNLSEIKNVVIEKLPADPEGASLVEGRMWYNTSTKQWSGWDGTQIHVW